MCLLSGYTVGYFNLSNVRKTHVQSMFLSGSNMCFVFYTQDTEITLHCSIILNWGIKLYAAAVPYTICDIQFIQTVYIRAAYTSSVLFVRC